MATEGGWYFVVGVVLGYVAGVAAFVGGWIYCMETYGFLFGFGLGWLPASILAWMVFYGVKYLWGPVALLVVWLIIQSSR